MDTFQLAHRGGVQERLIKAAITKNQKPLRKGRNFICRNQSLPMLSCTSLGLGHRSVMSLKEEDDLKKIEAISTSKQCEI
jgi:hypothetical protein